MKVKLVSIGNSRGVRIPASVIKECGLEEELDLRVEHGTIVLAPFKAVRSGWDQAFADMAQQGDDAPLLPEQMETSFDIEDWRW